MNFLEGNTPWEKTSERKNELYWVLSPFVLIYLPLFFLQKNSHTADGPHENAWREILSKENNIMEKVYFPQNSAQQLENWHCSSFLTFWSLYHLTSYSVRTQPLHLYFLANWSCHTVVQYWASSNVQSRHQPRWTQIQPAFRAAKAHIGDMEVQVGSYTWVQECRGPVTWASTDQEE